MFFTAILRFLIKIGMLIGRILPFRNKSGLFFFFPFYHTGGAEKVHLDIVNCFTDEHPWVFFTKRSSDKRFLASFKASARCFDFGWLMKYTYPISVGVMSGLIGKHCNARVFGCNTLFYYLLLPHLSEHVRATDLLHAMGGGAERFPGTALARLSQRVVIGDWIKSELLAFYRTEGVEKTLDGRVVVVPNRVTVPAKAYKKDYESQLNILFVGRGSDEKRIDLIGRAAHRCYQQGLAVDFTLVGDVSPMLEKGDENYCTLTGAISDSTKIRNLYERSHILLITSSREGFPVTVMEGMASGCVPVCTEVGGIPEHIRHLENGWLLPARDDNAVVDSLLEAIISVDRDRQLLERLSSAAFEYARLHFSGEQFCEKYRKIIAG